MREVIRFNCLECRERDVGQPQQCVKGDNKIRHSNNQASPIMSTQHKKNGVVSCIKHNLLVILMLLAVSIAIPIGICLRSYWSKTDYRKIAALKFPGDLFLNMLGMATLPLIVSSLITSLAKLDCKTSGKMGLKALIYFVTTSTAATIIGIVLVVSIQPGYKGDATVEHTGSYQMTSFGDSFMDLMRNLIPRNLVEACFQQVKTKVKEVRSPDKLNYTIAVQNQTNNNSLHEKVFEKPELVTIPGTNIIGLVMFSVVFGAIISQLGDKGKPLADVFESLNLATMKLVNIIIWYGPFGTIFLVSSVLVETQDSAMIVHQLAFLVLTVFAGMIVHAAGVLPAMFFIITRKNPFLYARNMAKAFVTVWITASSSATLPITMQCLRDNAGVDDRVVKFIAPIGATLNMDGEALYEAVCAIFIAQRVGRNFSLGEIILVSISATSASIGAAGVPGAGLIALALVLTSVGLPVDQIAIIMTVDWFIRRFRGIVNILGDAFCAGIVEHLSKDDLQEHNPRESHVNGDVTTLKSDDLGITESLIE